MTPFVVAEKCTSPPTSVQLLTVTPTRASDTFRNWTGNPKARSKDGVPVVGADVTKQSSNAGQGPFAQSAASGAINTSAPDIDGIVGMLIMATVTDCPVRKLTT